MRIWISICKYGNAVIILGLMLYLFLLPGLIIVKNLRDPGIRTNEIPRIAWDIFEDITPPYEEWARARVDSGRATELNVNQIAGTEWPLFGSVFYLWGIEALQEAWEEDPAVFQADPGVYARGAIDAAVELVIDPGHAKWVIDHWGDDYLHRENVFYRVLIISALVSQHNLTGTTPHMDLLRDQVKTLSKELDESPHGVLDDYPNECYPLDVLTAIAAIQRADAVLGTDHSAFVERARRGFSGCLLDKRGLPPYMADPDAGIAYEPSRGCGISYGLLNAPELWPEVARDWYARYEKYFWQDRNGMVGFREFPKDLGGQNLYWDVDSGPVIDGIGVAASAFGVAAARINGRFDHAYPLTAITLVFSWPMPDGRLLIPRFLSNAADAPLLGEACILYTLTRTTQPGFEIREGGRIPPVVFIALSLYFLLAVLYTGSAIRSLLKWRRRENPIAIVLPRIQIFTWFALVAITIPLLFIGETGWAILALLGAQLFPRHA